MDKEEIPPIGTKVKLTLLDIFKKPYEVIGKISKEPYQHGYHCEGGWGLYYREGDIPCYKIHFTPKRKRTAIVLKVKDIVSISEVGGAG